MSTRIEAFTLRSFLIGFLASLLFSGCLLLAVRFSFPFPFLAMQRFFEDGAAAGVFWYLFGISYVLWFFMAAFGAMIFDSVYEALHGLNGQSVFWSVAFWTLALFSIRCPRGMKCLPMTVQFVFQLFFAAGVSIGLSLRYLEDTPLFLISVSMYMLTAGAAYIVLMSTFYLQAGCDNAFENDQNILAFLLWFSIFAVALRTHFKRPFLG